MRYPGSKARYAKPILDLVLQLRGDRQAYLEPFIGGCNSFQVIAPHFKIAAAGDAQEDVALLWAAVARGWLPPETVTEQGYAAQRHAAPSALRGFVGSGCSFGGKWFGGYARGTAANGSPRNYAAESRRSIQKTAPLISHATILHRPYEQWPVDASCVVYADPPYAGTLKYATDFDHGRFWDVARSWADSGALVLVSEQSAPAGWEPIHTFDRRTSTALAADRTVTTEHVYTR